jgi:hypothetical protein
MAARLAKWELRSTLGVKTALEVDQFLSPTMKTDHKTKPVVIKHYGDTFNAVDRFNGLLSHIAYPLRILDLKHRLLVGMIESAIVQSWVLLQDWKLNLGSEEEIASLKKATRELADQLLQQ